jgi:hypothetical protein
MKFKFTVLSIILISLIYSPSLFSQDENQPSPLQPGVKQAVFNIGPVFGFNRSLHTVQLATFESKIVPCPNFENGNDNGYFFGINTEIFFLGQKRTEQSVIVRLLYNTFPSFFEVGTNDYYPSLVRTVVNGDTIIETKFTATTNTLQVNYNVITIEAQYKFNPVFNFGVIIGPTIDFVTLKKTLNQKFKLLSDDPNVQFERNPDIITEGGVYTDNDRTIIVHDGDIPNSSSFRFGIKAGVQYEFDLPGLGKIVPSANYNFGVTKLSASENWRVNAFQIGVDIRFQIKRFFGM